MTTSTDDALWAAIAEPSRRRVLDLLVRGDATASALAAEVPFTRQAVMKHLAVLEQAKLVTRHKEGREVLFRVDPGRLDEASRALAQVAQAWERRLVDIKQIAEAGYARARTELGSRSADDED
jgi:DNA-binding transcriptional ArsR family regulator